MTSQLEEIQALKKEIQEIKLKLLEKDSTIKTFGRAYSNIGTSNSDFLIKTKGLVKIQWGNKFIDLIKDGKINADAKFIYKLNEVGAKDGIYIIGDDLVILQVGGSLIPLKGEVGTTYVSFLGELKTTPELKYTALTNIGFLYKSLSEVDSTSLQNGIIYIESELLLYIVQNGKLSKFSIALPNPITNLVIILKSNDSKGSLLIVGKGIENSLAFDNMYLYNTTDGTYLDSNGDIYFRISDLEKIKVSSNSTVFSNDVVSSMIKSNGANAINGFRLYTENNVSTLEVDNLIVRNLDSTSSSSIPIIDYLWYYQNNVITGASISETDSAVTFNLNFAYENQFKEGQVLYTYYLQYSEDDSIYTPILLPLKVEKNEDSLGITAILMKELLSEDVLTSLNFDKAATAIKGGIVFLISNQPLLRSNSNNLDIINPLKVEEATSNDTVTSRFGNIEELNLKGKENSTEVPIKGSGVYSNNGAFLKAQYTKDYDLPSTDSSTKFASTEWVKNLMFTIDIDFTTNTVDFNTEEYLKQPKILSLITNLKDNTSNTYKGFHGQLTVVKVNGTTTVSGMIRGILKDGSYSYRTINGVYNGTAWKSLASYIIQAPFNVGYYWSSEISSKNTPISPTYIGTTYEGFKLSSTQKYLWYTNDGDTWNLILSYIELTLTKLYIATTVKGSWVLTNGSTLPYPAGFICYYNGTSTVENKYGASNFINGNSVIKDFTDKISKLTANAKSGVIPSNASYPYIWSISEGDDRTDSQKWTLEASYSTISSYKADLNLLLSNSVAMPSQKWVEYDPNTFRVTKIVYPEEGTNYWEKALGTPDNWKDVTWRKYFLMNLMGRILDANKLVYDPSFGFSFNYTRVFKFRCFGYTGYFVGSSGELLSPTNDDPNDMGYLPTPTLDFLSGHMSDRGYTIDFCLMGLKIGRLINTLGQTNFNNKVGAWVDTTGFYEIGNYTSWLINITDMSTGKMTVINAKL